ncbi:MAG: ATP-binding protein [Mollicutes bacterium]|nr:ATP-binding protein [Mollicutes bacterium]
MFGKIKYISDNIAVVEINKEGQVIANLMNLHVVFEYENDTLLGEVKNVDEDTVKIQLLGEFVGDKFIPGTIKKPSLSSTMRIINDRELDIIMGKNETESLYIGKSPTYNERIIYANINDLFSNHLAIFGNSGSGKSCSVSRIVQNIYLNKNFLTYNANMFIFDAYGEYKNAFRVIDEVNPNYQYKFLTTNPTDPTDMLLQIPIFLLTNDDIALLLSAENHAQLTIIERMMKLVKLFSKNDEQSEKLKNHLIASAIQAVLFSNQNASGKKNDIFTIIASCQTPALNMNAEIQGIGYTRRFSECFKIDSKGEFGESVLINEYIAKHLDENIESQIEIPKDAFFTLNDMEKALNFTLIGEGFLNNRLMEDSAIILKVRLHSLINSKNNQYFDLKQYLDLDTYISSLIIMNNKRSQIININLEDIDDNLAKVIVKILSKMLFDFAKSRKVRASIPFHLIIEEAHRYVVKDNDQFLLGYNIFERIAKEGRKYGVMLNLISQRPVDISETVVAQMSNFLVHKMTHPKDLEYIEKMLPNISADVIEKLNSLQPGTLVAFGSAFKIPLLIKMELPSPLPYSSNCNVVERWKGTKIA